MAAIYTRGMPQARFDSVESHARKAAEFGHFLEIILSDFSLLSRPELHLRNLHCAENCRPFSEIRAIVP
jgi:hypothetical protein